MLVVAGRGVADEVSMLFGAAGVLLGLALTAKGNVRVACCVFAVAGRAMRCRGVRACV